jgi:modulator of FtsH protease HflC
MKLISKIIVFAICIFFLYESARFKIADNELAVITQFGKLTGSVYKVPGEYFKIPLIQKVNYFKKNQFLSEVVQEVPTREYEILLWQSRSFWKIIDPIKYYKNLNSYNLAKDIVFDIVGHSERTIVTTYELVKLTMSEETDNEGNYKCQYDIEDKIKDLSQPKLNDFGIKLVGYEAKIKNTGKKLLPNKTLNSDG